MSKIELINVCKSFDAGTGRLDAVRGVNLTVAAGEFVSLIGPSGCGKSTLFKMICGLVIPDGGYVLINGGRMQKPGEHLCYMPQKDLLMPWRTVLDNVTLAMDIAGGQREKSRQAALSMLPIFGLEGFAGAYPAQLSGGMRQRAALMRTILAGREIVLLDEPFGALDAITRFQMQKWLLDIWLRFNKTILFVTHDVEEAIFLSDHIYVMTPRPGTIRESIPVPLERPRQQSLVAESNFMEIKKKVMFSLEYS